MPRLRNIQSGAVVSCSDETAARLGGEWQAVSTASPSQPAVVAGGGESATVKRGRGNAPRSDTRTARDR